MKTEWLEMSDQTDIYVRIWEAENPKAAVQLVHGMAEHAGRYERFAEALNRSGYTVIASDHRGHGETGKQSDSLGDFPASGGWNRVVEDLVEVRSFLEGQYHPDHVFLIGHSMGSFLSRSLMAEAGDRYRGVILSGTAGDPGIMGRLGQGLAAIQMPFAAAQANTLMDRLSFGSYNRSFEPNRTAFDWLSRDEKEVDKYIEDPLCGFVCTTRFYRDLLGGLLTVNGKENMARIPKNLPICLMSGDQDPVGEFGEGIQRLASKYQEESLPVTIQLFSGARHEILNEINRDEVMGAMVDWMKQHDEK